METNDQEDDGDEDMIMVSQRETFTCPLSQRTLTRPMRNNACGHVYEQDAIHAYMEGRNVVACPIPGCPHQVTKNGLEMDRTLARRIQRVAMRAGQ